MTFAELGLSEPILRAVAREGYSAPTPIQLQAIPHLLAGRDLLGCAQTGTGKTAAFALPLLHRFAQAAPPAQGPRRPIRVLVLSPTRELAAQIGESFQAYGRYAGLRHTVVFGGVGQQPQVRAMRQGVDVLVATPGRLLDLMNQGVIALGSVEVFVLDEADRMLDMGFLPDVRRVIAKLPSRRQTILFSATMPEAIAQLANSILHNPIRVHVAPVKATTELIAQSVYFVSRQQKSRLLASFLRTQQVGRALVFTRTKRGADRVARQLNQAGIRADAMHGNKSQSARQRTLADFKASRTPVLVATDIAARGIDVEGISHVLNYDLPNEPETYVHRIGRTGRAGCTGFAVSFCDEEERQHLQAIERLIRRRLLAGAALPGVPDLPPQEAVERDDAAAPQPRSRKAATRGKQPGKPKARTHWDGLSRHHRSGATVTTKRRAW